MNLLYIIIGQVVTLVVVVFWSKRYWTRKYSGRIRQLVKTVEEYKNTVEEYKKTIELQATRNRGYLLSGLRDWAKTECELSVVEEKLKRQTEAVEYWKNMAEIANEEIKKLKNH